MMEKNWKIIETLSKDQPSQTLRDLLQKQWLLPRRFVYYLRTRHNVLVNGQYYPVNHQMQPADIIELNFNGDEFRTPQTHYQPTPHPRLNVLFENRDVLVVNKPAGQKMHPNQPLEIGTLLNDAAGYLKTSSADAFMVHRLDQATSGAVAIAKNPIVVPILDRRISQGQMHRQYLALVAGNITPDAGKFDWPIGRDLLDQRKRRVNGFASQPALTYYQVAWRGKNATLVRLQLATGRTHQLRVHLAYSGHPIIGDPLYGTIDASRMMLHGIKQQLVLPFTEKIQTIQAPIDDEFKQILLKYK